MFSKNAGANQPLALAQATDYYPFGKSFEDIVNGDKNRYLYNGKELQEQVIGGTQFGWYDYGARFYDPEIARWHSVDPLAEDYEDVSLYCYGLNNPILFIDIDGMAADSASSSKPPIPLPEVVIRGSAPAQVKPYEGFWGIFYHFWTGGIQGNGRYNLDGKYIGPAPIMGMPPDLGFKGGINTIYKGVKSGLPYIGKSFNLTKRYSKELRKLLRIEPVLNNIDDPKLLRAIEQKIIEHMRGKGPVSNVRNAFNPKNKEYGEYMAKATKWLDENAKNWKDLF